MKGNDKKESVIQTEVLRNTSLDELKGEEIQKEKKEKTKLVLMIMLYLLKNKLGMSDSHRKQSSLEDQGHS